jgi:hypothetical protein
VFDVSKEPPMEYRDAMPQDGFKKHFSWDPDGSDADDNIKWKWHDKTPFPWERIIEEGIPDGVRHACASHLISAAERVSKNRELVGGEIDQEKVRDVVDRKGKYGRAAQAIVNGLQNALSELGV